MILWTDELVTLKLIKEFYYHKDYVYYIGHLII